MTEQTSEELPRRQIPLGEVDCKICEKSIYRIFVEHIQSHLDYEQLDKMSRLPVERVIKGKHD